MNSNLRILYTNIRSLKAHYDDLLLALQNLPEKRYDIIALSETWIPEEHARLYPLQGYKLFIQARNDGRKSGGVILYVHDTITVTKNQKIELHTAEMLCLTLRLNDTCMKESASNNSIKNTIMLILCYRDCTLPKTEFLQTLEPVIEENKNKNILFLGDLNINLLDIEESADYLNIMESAGFESIQNQPTRNLSCLDHVFSKGNQLSIQTKLSSFRISDHSMVMIEVGTNRWDVKDRNRQKEVKILNEKKFIKKLIKVDWSWTDTFDKAENNRHNIKDVNAAFQKLFELIQGCRDKAIKTIKYKHRRLRQPWATKELVALAAEKSAAYNLYRADQGNGDLQKKYKLLSAQVKKETRKAKTEYYSTLLDKNLDDPKKYWEVVNGVRGVNAKQNISEIKIGQSAVLASENPDQVAQEFNVYFNQVPVKLLTENCFDLSEATGGVDVNDLAALEGREGIGTSHLKNLHLTPADVKKIILNLKNKKSAGHDGTSAWVIRQLPDLFSRILTPLFNESLKQGIFPDLLKIAIIVPVYKSGEKNLVKNYRPISLLSTISKIFENCVHEKLNNYLEHIKFYAPQQFGFLKSKSTDTALHEHISQITESIENNRATIALYLDLAKAFDTVNHRVLIQKLSKTGVGGSLLLWFASYLGNRKHRVKIENTQSGDLDLKIGVPQGSVLGPLLFVIYMNDLFSLPLKASIIGYADDTSLLYSAATREEVISQFGEDWGLLFPWFRANYLHLNTNKCKCIVYAYKMPRWGDSFMLTTNVGVIERVDEMKYLGLILDGKLTWKNHSIYLQSKLRKINFLFYHLKNYFNKQHLKKLYTSLYESVLSYGMIHWGASKHNKPLKMLQNRVCRTILGHDKRTSEAAIYTEMKVAKLEELHRIRVSIFVFKNKWLFQLHTTGLQTRTGDSTVAAHVGWKKEHSRMQLRYQGYLMFNTLPQECRQERRVSSYKRLLKKFILKY